MAMPSAEAFDDEIRVYLLPQAAQVCTTYRGGSNCKFWWTLIMPGSPMTAQEAWNSIYGESGIYADSNVY